MGLSHSPSIVTDGLDFYVDPNNTRCYPGFGNTVYNIVNSSIGGTLVGYTSNPMDSTQTRSFNFDGVNDFIDIVNSSSWNFSSLSICIWFKKNQGSVFKGVVDKGRDNYGAWSLCIDETANRVTFKVRIGGVNRSVTTSSNYTFNGWTFIAGVFDGSNLSIYQNESISSTATYFGSIGTNSYNIRIGADNDGNCVAGLISSVFIYGRALSAAEINQNYHATKKKYLIEENIVTNGLILNLDPGKNTSYPGTGNTIYDLAGFGNTGTLVSTTFSSLNSGSLSGVISKNSSVNSGQNFTVSAWVYPTGFGQRMAIVGNAYPYSTNAGWYFFIANNYFGLNQSVFFSAGTDQVSVGTISYLVSINKWHYVSASVTNGGSSVKIYVDGIEATYGRNSLSNVSLDYSTNEFYVGKRHSATGDGFAGNISQVKIYNRALSATEIQQNYNATKGRFLNALPPVRNGLVLELDALSYSGFGNTWYDLSGSNYHTTLTNGPTFSGAGNTLSIAFDGSNDYGISNINKTVLGSSFTISFLFSVASSAYGCIFQFADQLVTGVPWIFLNRESSSLINWYIDGQYRLQAGVSTSENALISMTYSNNVWTSYKNGAALGTTSTGIGSYGGNNLIFAYGYFAPTSSKFNLFTIHNRALSAYEIKQNFDYYRTRYGI
jgi:hypothetical protein